MSNCEWYNNKIKKLSEKLFYPDQTNEYNKKIINSIEFQNIDYNHDFEPKFKKIKKIDFKDKINKLNEKKKENFEKIKNKDITEKKKEQLYKTYETKLSKKINNLGKIVKSRKIGFQVTKKNEEILLEWMNECNNLYNFCVELFNSNEKISIDYTKLKLIAFKKLYEGEKPVPYDILTDMVKVFCSNVKSCFTNLKNNNIKHFTINKRKYCNSICIPKKSINSNGFFTRKLDKINNFDKKIKIEEIKSDTRLVYDRDNKKFYLFIPQYFNCNAIKHKSEIVSLDPGEKIFMSYYSLNNYGFIGNDIRKPILKIESKIRKYQRGLSNKKNVKKNKLRNRKSLKLKIRKCYKKIRNIVKELHNQTALYLCRNYKRIIIPPFETQNMVSNKKGFKTKLKEIKKEKNRNILKEKIKSFRRRSKLNGRVKFVLLRLSHYKFRQHLLHKCKEYGCQISVNSEEYTSKCCGKCGFLSEKYKDRIKECTNCNKKIHRDINGARNILLKNYKEYIKF
jgi:transposase